MTTFLIDSNTIADFLSRQEETLQQINSAMVAGDTLNLCRPVHYEVLRGLLWRDAFAKHRQFERSIGLLFVLGRTDRCGLGTGGAFLCHDPKRR